MKSGKEKTASKESPGLPKTSTAPSKRPCVSIDFGTSFLLVAAWSNNKVEIITNEEGTRTTPAYLSFAGTDILIGETARAQLFRNPKNTIYDIKKMLGRTYAELQEYLPHWPFTIKPPPPEGGSDSPLVAVTYNGEEKLYKPTELAGILLTKMKKVAEHYCATTVQDVVITIPFSFNERQRNAMVEAVRCAGLEPIKLVHEATATALAYGYDNPIGDRSQWVKHILVFHLGGGSYDLTLLRTQDGVLELVGQYNDGALRGTNFDERILDLCIGEFEKKTKVNIRQNMKAIKKLELICESAKVVLSTAASVPIEVDSLAEGMDYSSKLNRAKYEEICSDLFAKTIPPIDQLLSQCRLHKTQIDDVIVEGGLGKTPKVASMLKEYFGGKEPRSTLDPDEVVAYGAAMQAALLEKTPKPAFLEQIVIEATTFTLRIETAYGLTTVLIQRGTPLPLRRTFVLEARKMLGETRGNKLIALVKLYQGEALQSGYNMFLGALSLEYEEAEIRSQAQKPTPLFLELTIAILSTGKCMATLQDNPHNKLKVLELVPSETPYTPEEVSQLVATAQGRTANDKEILNSAAQLKKLEEYCANVAVVAHRVQVAPEVKERFISEQVNSVRSWILLTAGSLDKLSAEIPVECQKKKQALEEGLTKLMQNIAK